MSAPGQRPECASPAELHAMRRAARLAATALGSTSPNPVVGCVLLGADGIPVAEGYHLGAGHPHAEVEALKAAGPSARGATAVVTLEPCAHQGRTGPCADALLEAGVTRVVYAVDDPTPEGTGGAERLRRAGVQVAGGVLRELGEHVNELWLTAVRRRRPCVTWKFGSTLDGRTAAADGSSRWITGAAARQDAHELRAAHDAVLVGTGTLRADDPHLGLRHDVPGTPPLRVVVDRTGGIDPGARVLDDAAPTLLVVAEDAHRPRLPHGHEVLALPADGHGIDVAALLDELYRRGLRSVLLEGGARLASAFVARGLLDRVVAYLAPVLLGSRGRPVLEDFGVKNLAEGRRFETGEVRKVGEDIRLVLRAPHGPAAGPR
ncbi:bifunctional diaminohydroxyphosphoribosylaminopyrimidine deaminase/5-amino-6-(5-phosphoribosylamino)uracil reductase RibD [Streptomyces albus]|uniref:bifunctional diaminohydroxyphosphoribosylaminopyrimidine deaminase/5-amino-6-(5-phosphoribosylamino)uracil reductase RibD n=1 Tax=Streptomyces albus TaxID=1888 RepID=UPI0036F71F28